MSVIDLELTADGVYRASRPMTDSDLAVAAPAALAYEPHASRSSQYQTLPTLEIAEALRRAIGVEIFGATQAQPREVGRRAFAKHVLRLRRPGEDRGGHAPELILTNSYDGSAAYGLALGVYRFVCANGIVCGETWDEARIPHIGSDAVPLMIEETRRFAGRFGAVDEAISGMSHLRLPQEEIAGFGRSALALRHGKAVASEMPPESVTAPRREEDQPNTLWCVFNRTQEALTRGLYGRTVRNARGHLRERAVRPIRGIDQNRQLNRDLWTLAETTQRRLAAA